MRTIEIARRLAALEQTKEARQAYTLAINESQDPGEKMEAAVYILQSGGDYKISYTCFRELYNCGYFQEDILSVMNAAFYEPNVKLLKSRYEKNCRLLEKYPYLFRKDFLPFEDLPVQFYPYDDNGYLPYYKAEKHFGDYINFRNPVISRNFFKDLEKPILASDVYSQYELEYLHDNVRKSEYVGRENHVYLHYTDWNVFCAYLPCLSLRSLLSEQKVVFLIEDELSQYPIDFKARFGIDYSQYAVQPVHIQEITRMIWHTQLSTHNGGDFFNEIFDSHPNLLVLPSMMFSDVEESVGQVHAGRNAADSLQEMHRIFDDSWPRYIVDELYNIRNCTDKDCMVALYLCDKMSTSGLDPASRIAPAVFFQPHFPNITYTLRASERGQTILSAENEEKIRSSPLFRNFKYIKTFTPMRRPTTSHGATVKFMYQMAKEAEEQEKLDENAAKTVVNDAITTRILNRSFMIDPEERLYKDSVLVRFEDGKLNPKATFTALAAFLDLPYTESLTYCSLWGAHDPEALKGNARGFDPVTVYRTYDEYVNDSERCFIEFFLQDAYKFYGYDFQYYDGTPMDEERVQMLISGFERMDYYIRETQRKVFESAKVSKNGQQVDPETEKRIQEQVLENYMTATNQNRIENAKVLLEGLRFVNKNGQPLRMMPKLELEPALLERPEYR